MKSISRIAAVAAAAFCCTTGSAVAAVTLVFYTPFTGGMPSNLADAGGVVRNGMSYGILIDRGRDGFQSEYNAVPIFAGQVKVLTSASVPPNDLLVIANDLTSDTSQYGYPDFSGMDMGGSGGVEKINLAAPASLLGGCPFALIWFDPQVAPDGSRMAGILTDPSFIIPSDGSTEDFSALFIGPDPIRPANNITFVPEASSALLGLFGAAAMLRRRR